MDPNQTLMDIREICREHAWDEISDEQAADMLTVLVDRIEAIDGWLSKGGFPPTAWERKAE